MILYQNLNLRAVQVINFETPELPDMTLIYLQTSERQHTHRILL